jgi:hypothetical protein
MKGKGLWSNLWTIPGRIGHVLHTSLQDSKYQIHVPSERTGCKVVRVQGKVNTWRSSFKTD